MPIHEDKLVHAGVADSDRDISPWRASGCSDALSIGDTEQQVLLSSFKRVKSEEESDEGLIFDHVSTTASVESGSSGVSFGRSRSVSFGTTSTLFYLESGDLEDVSACEAEGLQAMKISDLKKCAHAAGASNDELNATDDADDVRATLVSLALSLQRESCATWLNCFHGFWSTFDGTAQISNDTLKWPNGTETRLHAASPTALHMVVGGSLCSGERADNKISWDDGDVWMRENVHEAEDESGVQDMMSVRRCKEIEVIV